MGLRRKLNLLTLSFTLVVIMILSYVLFILSNQSFYTLEEHLFMENLNTTKSSFEKEFMDLEYILTDWAEWDLTYSYVQGLEPDYIEENLGSDILGDLNLDYLYIFDENDNVIYSLTKNPISFEQIPISQKNLSTFKAYPNETGIITFNDKLVMFASMPITDNEGLQPAMGFMGFGRIINESYIDTLSDASGMDFSFSQEMYFAPDNMASANSKTETYGHYELIASLVHSKNQSSTLVIKIPVKNTDRALVVKTTLENAVQSLGTSFIKNVLFMVVLILGFFGLLLNFAFGKIVINRLIKLNAQIAFIRKMRNTKERLDSHGHDEIGELGENINLMLEEIDEIHSEMSHFATFDQMTGVYNRRVGLDMLSEVIKIHAESNAPFSVIYIDIDGLKNVNDRFGHAIGDKMIKNAIRLVVNEVPEPKCVVRLGGDEFLIILKNHSFKEAKAVEELISESISKYNKESQMLYSLSFSMGTVEYEKTMQLEEILERADKEMYLSKEKKKRSILD
ncbi:MAG: diguanylate cyclase [Clostridia bacterium]|nr:diguanylate cyclase [Clostridia bacterium]